MEHPEAVKSGAVERYLLGELQGAEREAFEEHFFDCSECERQVRLGVEFQANARIVLREDPALAAAVAERRHPWFRWNFVPAAAMAACAVLVAVVGYQNLTLIPQLRQAAVAGGEALLAFPAAPASGVRAAAQLTISRKTGKYSLFVPHEWEEVYSGYHCELERHPGASVRLAVKVEDGSGDFSVLLPVASLEPGRYVLNVYGVRADGQKSAVARFPLTLTD